MQVRYVLEGMVAALPAWGDDEVPNPGANFKSISHRCYLREVAFERELTKETIYLPLGCLLRSACRVPPALSSARGPTHPGVELRANFKSISHRYHLFEMAFVWELTEKIIHLPLGCLQGGSAPVNLGSP